MISCPKCNSSRIRGPTYRKRSFGREALEYVCDRCGYSCDEATADNRKDATEYFPRVTAGMSENGVG
jgi:transposase-like protein